MTLTAKIRERLLKNPDLLAGDLARKLRCSSQAIYQVRCAMKKEQRATSNAADKREISEAKAHSKTARQENLKPLGQYILQILENCPEGMTDCEVTEAVKKSGYKTRSNLFLTVVRKKLYKLTLFGHIVKNGINYSHPTPLIKESSVVINENPILVTLNEIVQLCKRAGGIDKVQELIGVIRQLQTPEK